MEKAHEEIIISGEKPHKCSQCKRVFTFKPSLHQHLRIAHGKKSYSCPECKESFDSPLLLQKHMQGHRGEDLDTASCLLCMEVFSQNDLLIQHLEVHSGEKPYWCDQCTESFPGLSFLQQHSTLHSGGKRKLKQFRCVLCPKVYSRACNLKTHMKCSHSETK